MIINSLGNVPEHSTLLPMNTCLRQRIIRHTPCLFVLGDMFLNKFDMRLHRSNVAGIEPGTIENLAPLAKKFIAPQLSQGLQNGIPFPLRVRCFYGFLFDVLKYCIFQDQIQFLSPQIRTDHGYVELGTDFLIQENLMRKQIEDVFRTINL